MSDKRTDITSPTLTPPTPRLRDTLALAAQLTIDWVMFSAFVSMLVESNHTPDEIHDWFLNSFATFSGVSRAEVAHAARLTAIQRLDKAKRRRREPHVLGCAGESPDQVRFAMGYAATQNGIEFEE